MNARLQYVAAKADEDIRAQLRAGKISLNQAYSMAHRDSAKTLPPNSGAAAEKKSAAANMPVWCWGLRAGPSGADSAAVK